MEHNISPPAPSLVFKLNYSIDLQALQAFGANEELTEERRQAGAVIESGVMTLMAEDEFLTNFPAPFTVD